MDYHRAYDAPMSTTRETIPTPDGPMAALLARPEGSGPWPPVVLLMDAFGLRAALGEMAERFARAGYVVLVPDLFHREGDVAPFDPLTTFSNPSERDRVMKLIASIDGAPAIRDVEACFAWLAARPDVKDGPGGVVGYCLGGRVAFAAAGALPDRIGAAASIHGGRIGVDGPTSLVALAPKVKARLYAAVAAEDQSHTPEMNERLEGALRAAGTRYELEAYDAQHGFAVPDAALYDAAASERHYARVIELFDAALRAGAISGEGR